jgi:hypothetical protein
MLASLIPASSLNPIRPRAGKSQASHVGAVEGLNRTPEGLPGLSESDRHKQVA